MFTSKPRGATQRPTAAAPRGPLVPTWLWTVFGIVVGLSCLALLYLWQPWQPASSNTQAAAQPTPTTSAAEDKKPANFQFYDLLPKQQVTPIPTQTVPDVIPDDPAPVVAPTSTSTAATGKPASHYILQVNSFQSADEADKQRAAVLLAGLPADVRHTTTADGQEWYRVISGPFDSRDEANKAQRQLQDSGIDALVVQAQ